MSPRQVDELVLLSHLFVSYNKTKYITCILQIVLSMTKQMTRVRLVSEKEAQALGEMMVRLYQKLPGFPSPEAQPDYYAMLANIAAMNQQPHTDVLVALSAAGELMGGVVYFSDMSAYGSGGTATQIKPSFGHPFTGG